MLRMLRKRGEGGEGGRERERDRDHMIIIMITYNIMFIVTNLRNVLLFFFQVL